MKEESCCYITVTFSKTYFFLASFCSVIKSTFHKIYCASIKGGQKQGSLLLKGCVVEDFLRIQVPVIEGSLDQAWHHHEHQHQNIDAGEHLIDHSGLLHPKRQQSCRTNTHNISTCYIPEHTQPEVRLCNLTLSGLPVSMRMMSTANMSGYSAKIPGAFILMCNLQKFSIWFPISSSKVALQARATLDVPERGDIVSVVRQHGL